MRRLPCTSGMHGDQALTTKALSPSFDLVADVGIGVSVPPSFVEGTPAPLLNALAKLDARIESSRIGRAIGDHRLFVFRRS